MPVHRGKLGTSAGRSASRLFNVVWESREYRSARSHPAEPLGAVLDPSAESATRFPSIAWASENLGAKSGDRPHVGSNAGQALQCQMFAIGPVGGTVRRINLHQRDLRTGGLQLFQTLRILVYLLPGRLLAVDQGE